MTRRGFANPRSAAAFDAAYAAMVDRWPVPVEELDLVTQHGTTHVLACGPPDAPPVVLLPGGGATATAWFAAAGRLSAAHRLYAVDVLGQAGRSRHTGPPLKTVTDLLGWLDDIRQGLDLEQLAVAGHSYGGWLALQWALHAPQHVRRLVLLDPTDVFGRPAPGYLARAVPLLVRPTTERMRRFLHWETAGQRLDPGWLEVNALGAAYRGRLVLPKRPAPERLRGLAVPTLVLLAGQSRAHDVAQVARTASELMPAAQVVVLPEHTHHTMPTEHAERLSGHLAGHLGG